MIAALLGGGAVWLMFPPGPERTPPLWSAALPLGLLLLLAHPAWALGGTVAVTGVMVTRRATAHRREAAEVAGRLGQAAETVASELRAGRSPLEALTAGAKDLDAIAPVVETARLGADVPAAMRALATRPGLGELRLIAGAWQVAERSGAGLAVALSRIAEDLRARRASARIVAGELASARATARLVAGLPVFVWLLGAGSGGSPLGFLVGGPAGWACLLVGGGLLAVGLWWLEAIARAVQP